MAEEKKGITVKIDADLHREVKDYVESQGLTMAEFVARALDDELHPKNIITGGITMEKMRTMAFQVPEELFVKIKDYLNRNHMTQKDFVIGLITKEIDRDLAARQEAAQRAVTAEKQNSGELADENEDERYGDSDEDFEDEETDNESEYDEIENDDSEYAEDYDEDDEDYEEENAEFDEDEDSDLDEAEDETAEDDQADEIEDTAEAEESVMAM